MKILITGVAGFIGFHLCESLLEQGCEVVGIDNVNDYYDVNLKYSRLYELGISNSDSSKFNFRCTSSKHDKFTFFRMDISDRIRLPKLFEENSFDLVCNLAAQAGVRYSLENPEAYVDSNVVGFLNLLECCRNHPVKHLLYASSSSVYGENEKVPFSETDNVDHPISLYAATKRSNELMAYTYSHLYKIPTSGLRFFTVYGPWGRPDMALFLFTRAIKNGEPIKVFNNGEMNRDFTYIDDIINGIEIVLENPPSGIDNKLYQLFNIGNGSPQPLKDFIVAIEHSIGQDAIKEFLPMQPGDVPRTWADTSSLEKLGYRSYTSIEEGVKKFVDWYENFYDRKVK